MASDSFLDSRQLTDEIRRELAHGERVVWSGRPLGGIRLKVSDAVMIPFSKRIARSGAAFAW